MLIPKVNIHNVHLLENPMKSTAYPLLPPPGTLKATEYFTIILLFVRRRANKPTERNEYYMANQHPWLVGRLP